MLPPWAKRWIKRHTRHAIRNQCWWFYAAYRVLLGRNPTTHKCVFIFLLLLNRIGQTLKPSAKSYRADSLGFSRSDWTIHPQIFPALQIGILESEGSQCNQVGFEFLEGICLRESDPTLGSKLFDSGDMIAELLIKLGHIYLTGNKSQSSQSKWMYDWEDGNPTSISYFHLIDRIRFRDLRDSSYSNRACTRREHVPLPLPSPHSRVSMKPDSSGNSSQDIDKDPAALPHCIPVGTSCLAPHQLDREVDEMQERREWGWWLNEWARANDEWMKHKKPVRSPVPAGGRGRMPFSGGSCARLSTPSLHCL